MHTSFVVAGVEIASRKPSANRRQAGLAIDSWRIHRRIGMSGGLFTRAAARELERDISAAEA